MAGFTSPLAEGRELKYIMHIVNNKHPKSPLAEGRELKYLVTLTRRDQGVAPRGGA